MRSLISLVFGGNFPSCTALGRRVPRSGYRIALLLLEAYSEYYLPLVPEQGGVSIICFLELDLQSIQFPFFVAN